MCGVSSHKHVQVTRFSNSMHSGYLGCLKICRNKVNSIAGLYVSLFKYKIHCWLKYISCEIMALEVLGNFIQKCKSLNMLKKCYTFAIKQKYSLHKTNVIIYNEL